MHYWIRFLERKKSNHMIYYVILFRETYMLACMGKIYF